MPSPSTMSISISARPVNTLRVEVTEGPDAPKEFKAKSDKFSIGTADGNALVLSDSTVSRYHVELECDDDGIHVRDLDSTNGTWCSGVRLDAGLVNPGATLKLGETTLRLSEGEPGTVELIDQPAVAGIIGDAPAMRRLMARLQRAAASDSSVLVVGESGTGKELIARAVHDLSERSDGPFEVVDCAGLPPTLIASELFGHEKGAFTGADAQRIGAFERAHKGTIFLDELGELPPQLQATLLGVLERRKFRRVGGQKEVDVDVRIVAATNRDLRSEVNKDNFRLDLYHRLAVVVLEVPALRERKEDIPLLVQHFLAESGYDGPVESLLPKKAMDQLKSHRWPGNVRELRNMIDATVALGETPPFHDMDAAPAEGDDTIEAVLGLTYRKARHTVLSEFETRYLKRLLEQAEGNVSKASRIAKMDRSHLTDLLRRHGLK